PRGVFGQARKTGGCKFTERQDFLFLWHILHVSRLYPIVGFHLANHDDPPSYPHGIVEDRVDAERAQAALERAIAPKLKGYCTESLRLYDALKARLDSKGQKLLSQFWDAQAGCMVAYEDLAWQISAEVERQKTCHKETRAAS